MNLTTEVIILFVECSSMNRYLQDLSHPSMTVVSRHRTNPASGEQRSVAVEGGKVKNYSGTYSFGVGWMKTKIYQK